MVTPLLTIERCIKNELLLRPTIIILQEQSHLPYDERRRHQKSQTKSHEEKDQTRRGLMQVINQVQNLKAALTHSINKNKPDQPH